MLTKVLTLMSLGVAAYTLYAGYTQPSAFVLRQEDQANHLPISNITPSGSYSRGVWLANGDRRSYGNFRGGGPGAGK